MAQTVLRNVRLVQGHHKGGQGATLSLFSNQIIIKLQLLISDSYVEQLFIDQTNKRLNVTNQDVVRMLMMMVLDSLFVILDDISQN